jgi:NADPH2:quinone reductase
VRAVLCKAYGPPESLVLEDVDPPAMIPGGVRIRVRAVGVNFPDVLLIKGEYQFKPAMPFAPGGEVAGEVIEIADGVTGVAVGDRVIAGTGWGGFAEEVVVAAPSVTPIPDGMGDDVAASLMTTYGTSAYALVDRGALQAGETLLVHGAAGGTGLAAVEIGKALGAVVIATAGDDKKLEVVREHGADHVINYTDGFKDKVKDLTGGVGADVIYDPVGGDVFDESLRCINWEGRLPAAPANLILLKSCQLVGVFYGAWAMRDREGLRRVYDQVFEWWKEGAIRPHISHRFPLERGGDAIQALIDRQVVGKAVVEVA